MTFFHCVNCIILTFAPFAVFYKASGINREGKFGVLVKSMIGFFISSVIKLAITATLANVDTDAHLTLFNEILYSLTYLIDAMGLAYLINLYKFEIISRIEFVALGWSAAEVLASKFMPLIVYSRSPEVDYKWIQFSLDSTCDLVFTLSFAMASWLALCAKSKLAPTPFEFGFLFVHILIPGLMNVLKNSETFGGWIYVAIHFVVSIALLIMGRNIYKRKTDSLKA